jgi:hypothetical protein
MNRRIDDAYNLIEEMKLNQVQWSSKRVQSRTQVPNKFEIDQIIKLQEMVKTLQMTEVRESKRLDSANASVVNQFFSCTTCGRTDYLMINCTYEQPKERRIEQVNMLNNFMPQNNPCSITYNLG